MWAYHLTGPSQLRLGEVASALDAQLSPGRIVLRSLAGGVCGSDIPKFLGRRDPTVRPDGAAAIGPAGYPLHEIVGQVVASEHPAVQPGTRVVGWADRSDGLAEYVVTSGDQVHEIGPATPAEEAVLIQPLACVLSAIDRLDVRGRRVAVLGLGPFGLLFARLAKARGATLVVGVDPIDRTTVGPSFGLDETVQATSKAWVDRLGERGRFDVSIEAVGHQVGTVDDATAATTLGGTVLCFGIPDEDVYPLNVERLMRRNLTIIGGVTRDRPQALASAVSLHRRDPAILSGLVTHRFGYAAAQQAFEAAVRTESARIKVVISLDGAQPDLRTVSDRRRPEWSAGCHVPW
jgi:threonine dehydrogenase-like Zn-dependent dehydrogenase